MSNKKKTTDPALVESILKKALVCRIAMVDGDRPYLIPMNFGYENRAFYFHTGLKGKKLGILEKNPNVCIEVDVDHRMAEGETACKWTMNFRSVLVFGKARFLESPDEKRHALDVIMKHYSDKSWTYRDEKLAVTNIIRVDVESMTGLVSGYDD